MVRFGVILLRKLVLLCTALSLSGCVSTADMDKAQQDARPAPAAVKAAIVSDARDFLLDPYSVRDAEISYMPFNAAYNWHYVCVKANVKNAMGGYAGRQTLAVIVRDGKLINNAPNSPLCASAGLKWEPFPELEALRDR